MAGKNTIQVEVLAETRKAASALARFSSESGLDKLGGIAAKAGAAVGVGLAAAGAAAGVYLTDAVGKAGNLEQSIGAVDTVFKGNADQMHKWAQDADKSVGLTQNSYNELATIIGTQLRNGGTAIDEIGGKTNDLIGLGADLSSMFGGTTSEAVSALSSALKGERDPIERYGVSLKQASIDAKAAELGFTKVGGSLSDEAQQAATLALIMEQTSDAHGNFAKEADTVQGKQARLAAQWENISSRIGTAFLPALAAAGDYVANNLMPVLERWGTQIATAVGPMLEQLGGWITGTVLPALSAFGTWIQGTIVPTLTNWATIATTQLFPILLSIGTWIQDASGWLVPLAAFIGGIVLAWQAWTIATAAWRAIATAAAAAQAILNAVMSANPIGLIVLLIAGLIAAGIALYQNNETVRNVIDAAWKGIKAGIDAVAGWIMNTAVPWIVGAWSTLTTAAGNLWTSIKDAFQKCANAIGAFVDGAKTFIGRVIDAHIQMATKIGEVIGNVVQFFKDLPGKVIGAITSLPGKLKDVGKNMIQGLIDGIKSMASNVVSAARGVVDGAINAAKALLGIASPSKVFKLIGTQTGQGFEIGMDDWAGRLTRAGSRMASAVVAGAEPGRVTVPAGAATAGPQITIQVYALDPTPDLGRRIAAALRPYLAAGGSLR